MEIDKEVPTEDSQILPTTPAEDGSPTIASSSDLSSYIMLFIMLLVAGLIVLSNLPHTDQYYYGADEGTYLRQATTIKNEGLAGFRTLAESFIKNPQEQTAPNPLRVAHLIIAAGFLKINNSMVALSYYSLLAFLAFGIINFIFIKKWWNTQIALSCTLLITYTPLTMGLARRALMDSQYFFISTLILLLFIQFIKTYNNRYYYGFLASLTFGILFKETILFIFPFFIAVFIWLKLVRQDSQLSYKHILLTMFVPGGIAGITYLLLLRSVGLLLGVLKGIATPSFAEPSAYIINYCSGPWYEHFVDLFIIIPWLSPLFFLYVGYYLFSKESNRIINVLISFSIYFIIVFSILPKGARYSLNLAWIYTLFAALILVKLAEDYLKSVSMRNTAIVAATLILGLLGINGYHQLFVINNIYDPVAYNLLRAERFIPQQSPVAENKPVTENKSQEELYQMMSRALTEPKEDNYLNLSFAYYKVGKYEDSIKIAENIIKSNPQNATAYNNICSAYGSMKQWDKGIEACNKALVLSPDFTLAKNNLAWLQGEKAKATKQP